MRELIAVYLWPTFCLLVLCWAVGGLVLMAIREGGKDRSEPECYHCRWFVCADGIPREGGNCRRFPPSRASMGWPEVANSWWCGEYRKGQKSK